MESRDVMIPRSLGATFGAIALRSGPPFGAFMGLLLAFLDVITGRFSAGRLALDFAGSAVTFGVAYGLCAALVLRGVVRVLPLDESEITASLQRVHFRHVETTGNVSRFDPGWRAGTLAGSIYVQREGTMARVVGPWLHVRKLEGTAR